MTSPLWPSGFDRSEVIPPVPAPRYKRKLITNEDSKYSSDKQNTGVSERTTEILPPPRRKHKPPRTQKTNTLIPRNNDKYENKKNELLEDVQIITPISNGEISPICNKVGPEPDACEYENYPCKPNDLNEQKSSNTSEMTDAFREIVDSSILKNFINNRVLDIPPVGSIQNPSYICVEQKLSTQDSDVDHSEENRVNSGLSENSATIVGVFYKPEYSLIKQMSENKLVNSNSNMNVSNELEPTVWSSSFVDYGKKTVVPPESMRIGNKMNKKDSEEDDSGVYFSDTKSPPHRNNDAEINDRNTNVEIDASSDLQFFEPLTCNDRDTFDNNSSDVGPNMYNEMLDCFEALTVNALREEVTGRLSLCSELSKNKVVENWLDNGEYLSKKKVIDSNLSEYLKNMLEVDESERSLSPYPLSTVDESSDISEREFNEETECGRQSLSLEACTVPSSPNETRENRNVDCRDKYLSSFVYTNGVNNVYNGCTEVTQCKIKSISVSESPVSSIEDVERVCNAGDVMVSSGNSISQPSFFFKETNLPASVSPSIENGAVNKLITFFETIHTEEDLDNGMESEYENGISDAIEDVDVYDEDSLLSSDTFGSVGKINDNKEYTDGHIVKNSPVCFTEQYESSPFETSREIESCSNECFIEEKLPLQNITDINCTNEFKLEPSFKYNFKDLELDESKFNYEQDLEDNTSQPIGKVKEQFVLPAEMKLISNDSDTITTLDFCENPPIDICDDIIDSASILHVNQIEQDIKELSPPTEFADDKEVQVIFDRNQVTEINRESYDSSVPNFNFSTKDLMESDDTSCPFKPTRIPIVILTEADITSIPIGSIELHPAESLPKDKDTEGARSDLHNENCMTDVTDICSNEVNNKDGEEDCLENAVTVVLEKNWGSIGLKIKGDGHGVVVSDILAGGAADQSGLVFQGLSPEKGLQEYGYSLKSAPCWKILNIKIFVILLSTI